VRDRVTCLYHRSRSGVINYVLVGRVHRLGGGCCFGLVIEADSSLRTRQPARRVLRFDAMMVADYLTLNVGSAETMGVVQAAWITQSELVRPPR